MAMPWNTDFFHMAYSQNGYWQNRNLTLVFFKPLPIFWFIGEDKQEYKTVKNV